MPMILQCTRTSIRCQEKLQLCHLSVSRWLISWHRYSISPRLPLLPTRIDTYSDTWAEHCAESLRPNGIRKDVVHRSVVPRLMTCADDPPVDLDVIEWCCFQSFNFQMHTWHQVLGAPQMRTWWMVQITWLRHSQSSTIASYRYIGQPGTCNVAYQ